MSSKERIESSRANGAKSRGPITPEGKLRSSRNATTHGLLADCVVLNAEDKEGFDDIVQTHRDRFQPADGVEDCIVEEMCISRWRLYRAWVMETRTLEDQIATEKGDITTAFNKVAASPGAALLHRYQSRLQLMYQRSIRTLIMLRSIERPNDDLPDIDLPIEPRPTAEDPSPPAPPAAQPTDSNAPVV